MKVELNGHTLLIAWKYSKKKYEKTNSEAPVTTIVVKDLTSNTESTSSVAKFNMDKDNKDKARRFSLIKFLSEHFPTVNDKKTRAIFWKAYNERNICKKKD